MCGCTRNKSPRCSLSCSLQDISIYELVSYLTIFTSDALLCTGNPDLALIVNVAAVISLVEGCALRADPQHPLTAFPVPTSVLCSGALLGTFGRTHIRILVVFDIDVAMVAFLLHYLCPIHGVHVTEGRILFNSYSAVHDMRESGQSYIRHPRILEDSKCVKLDELVPAYHGQPGEDVLERDDFIGSIEKHKVSHLGIVSIPENGAYLIAGIWDV